MERDGLQQSAKPCRHACKDGFGIVEKVLMRTGFYGFILIGAWAIARQSAAWAAVYLAGSVIGLVLVVYVFLCRYCPYPFRYRDCLFFPYQWLTSAVRPSAGRMGRGHQFGFSAVMAMLLLFPHPWLIGDPRVLLAFWMLAGPTVAALPLYYCRRCHHHQCVFNRAGLPQE